MTYLNGILAAIPDVVYAILLLIVAFIAAKIAKSLALKFLKLIKFDSLLAKCKLEGESQKSVMDFLPKLVYLVVFLLFLPAVLDKLGMHSVSAPIVNIVNSFLGILPKIVGACLILVVGIYIAGIIKELLKPVFRALKLDVVQEKAGIKASESTLISTVLANLVYALILLVVITAAIQQIGIAAISEPANSIISMVFGEIPYILGAVVVIAVGVVIANLVGRLLEDFLAGVGADSLIEKITGQPQSEVKISLSKVAGTTVKYIIAIILAVEGLNVLQLPVLTNIGMTIIGYMPSVIAVVLIAGIGVIAVNIATAAIKKANPEAGVSIVIIKTAVYVVVVFLALGQLGIAPTIVNTAFIVIIAAIGVASAIAFGIGGREFAHNMLAKLEKALNGK